MYGSFSTASCRSGSVTKYGDTYPLSNCMPSTKSSSMPNVFDSSTVTTPSLPTLSMASAITSPMLMSLLAEIDATWAISALSSMSVAWPARASTAAATALSTPRFSAIGLAPAATLRMPSCTSACASTVAVVVPSPAMSFVLVATSFTSCAPMFSKGSSSSTSRAIDTPSFVIVGAPNFFSTTTLRPRGPSVTRTVSASLFTPDSSDRRASSSNLRIFGMAFLLLHDREDVAGVQDQQVIAFDGDLGAAVLRVDDGVAHLYVDRNDLVGLIRAATGSDSQHLTLLRLLLGGVGDDQPAGGGLLRFAGL